MMTTSSKALGLFLFLAGLLACSAPKPAATDTGGAAEKPAETPAKPPREVAYSPCARFETSGQEDRARELHVLYRDYIRAQNYAEAFPLWQEAYALAPAADGQRNFHFTDGVRIYEYFISQASDEAKKEEYIQAIAALYERQVECYPADQAYVYGKMAYDYFYTYPGRKDEAEIFGLFRQSIDLYGDKAPAFILNPFTDLLIRQINAGAIGTADAQRYVGHIKTSLKNGLKERKDKGFEVVDSYVPARLSELEAVENFYDCAYYVAKYYPEFEAEPSDCDVIGATVSRLRWGKCPADAPELQKVLAAYNSQCRQTEQEAPTSTAGQAVQALNDGRYREAARLFDQAIGETSDNERKAQYNLLNAKIYYAYLKDYGTSRSYARKAASLKDGWGEPYLLIGNLYASSGPLCGPGRGFDSQVVVWAAIDQWQRAKSVDPSAAGKANQLIGRYAQYMPSKEDIFQRNLKEGGSYKIGCWIQETTTVRAAN